MEDAGYTCVLCKDEKIYTSKDSGVKPLLDFYDSKENLRNFCAADKVVGRAAAFIYIALGVKEVYASVMSEGARDLLLRNGIKAYCGTLAKQITNRLGTGMCPMEAACLDAENSKDAICFIKEKIGALKNK